FLGSAASFTTRAGAPSRPTKLHVAGSCAYAGSTKANAMITHIQARARRKLPSSARAAQALRGLRRGAAESAMRFAALMNCRKGCVIGRTGCSSGSDDDRKAVSLRPVAGNIDVDLVNAGHVGRQDGPGDRIRMSSDRHLNVVIRDRKRVDTGELAGLNIGSDGPQTR